MKLKTCFIISHWAIFSQILNQPCRYKALKIDQHNAGHVTKMAAMPIYGKSILFFFFPGTTGLILMKLSMKHQIPKPFIYCSNYDPRLTLTYFMARKIFCNLGFFMAKCDNDEFTDIIASCDLELGY